MQTTPKPSLPAEERILILTRLLQDAQSMAAVLVQAGLSPVICEDLAHCSREIPGGAAAVLLTDQVLEARELSPLLAALELQPAWSDLPVVCLTSPQERPSAARALQTLFKRPVTLLDRPLRQATLLSVVHAALRARRRQYQVRDLLAALHQERDFTSAVLDTAGALVVVLDADGRITRFNRACEALTGYTEIEVLGRVVWESLIPAEELPGVREQWEALKAGSYPNHHENHWLAKDGSRRLIAWSNTALVQAEGEIGYVIGTGLDITERKRAEELLGKQAALLDLAHDAIMVRDSGDQITFWSRGAERTYGWTREEAMGQVTHVLLKTRFPRLAAELKAELAEKGQWEGELAHTRKDGREIVVASRWAVQRDQSGRQVGVLEINRDITQRKRAEAALRRSEALYRTMARNIPDGAMSVVDRDLRYLVVEGGLLPRLGLSKETMEGRTVQEVFAGEIGRRRAEHFLGALAGESSSYETEYHGRNIWSQFVPLRDEQGQVLAAMSLGLDITERTQAEQALRAAKDALARANQDLERKVQERTAKLREAMAEMEQISYSMIHDLRAPLRAVQSFGGILEHDPENHLSRRGRELVAKMRAATHRMDSLIVDVLNYSRIVRGQLPLRPVDPGALARSIVETYPAFGSPNAQVRVAPDLPLVIANEAALTQCLSQLLNNAVKFAKPGVPPQIRICAECFPGTPRVQEPPKTLDAQTPNPESFRGTPHDPSPSSPFTWVRIVVEDNGIGIPPELHGKIFEIFQRLSNLGEGTGMGLAIVKKAAERMGGRVGLESEPGKGSRFWIQLPAAAA